MTRISNRSGQKGAVIVTTALVLLLLLGFMGIAFDFGRLFVYRAELQTAMDACALAAAQELEGNSTSATLTRATNAGRNVAALNRAMFQAQAVDGPSTEVTFSDSLLGPYAPAVTGGTQYVRCQQALTGITPWLLQALAAFTGEAGYAQARDVAAMAVATRRPAQTSCAVPVGVCLKTGAPAASPWGFANGEWIEGVRNGGDKFAPGQFGWLNFSQAGVTQGGAARVKAALTGSGECGLPSNPPTEPGAKTGADAAWNTRFGIYQGDYQNAFSSAPADYTAYSWYHSGTAASAPWGRFADTGTNGYRYHRDLHSAYNLNSTLRFQGGGVQMQTGNSNRRVVTAGILSGPACNPPPTGPAPKDVSVIGWGCFLLLNPLDKPSTRMWIEFIGDASAAGSPCTTAGLPGGATGVRVPTLVQ